MPHFLIDLAFEDKTIVPINENIELGCKLDIPFLHLLDKKN